MKTQGILYTIGMMFVSLSLSAQAVSKDSIQSLNQQKEAIEISQKLNEDKTKLAKLENELADKTAQVQKTADDAQKSADENKKAAADLMDNAQDKKLANAAKKAARKANSDTKNAKNAVENQEKLQKNIQELKDKIAENETKLSKVSVAPVIVASSTSAPDTVTKSESATSANKLGSGQILQQNEPVSNTQTGSAKTTETSSDAMKTEMSNGNSNTGFTNETAQKVMESTYKNYPQQSGQPTIIINNIVIPADYNRPKSTENQPAPMQQYSPRDREDYEDYKAWLRERGMQKGNGAQSSSSSSASQQEMNKVSEDKTSSATKGRLTLKERFGELPARNSGMWLIPMVGVHASGFDANFKDNEAEGRTGWNAGLDFRFHVKRFFIQPGVHYFNTSMRITSKDAVSEAPLLDGPRIHSLKVPVMLGLYLTKANSGFFKFNVKAGAVGNYVMAADKSTNAQFSKDNIEDFSYGLNAGLGFELGLITLDLSHEWGITKYFKDTNNKNNILRLTLGVKI